MDGMDMHHGTPWLDYPLSLDGYRDYTCEFNTTWQCAYQSSYWIFWYEADHRYALPTVAFFMTAIILFSIGRLASELAPKRLLRSKPARRTTALLRWLSYRSWRLRALDWNTAPLGVLMLGAVGAIFFLCMVLGPKPYYWPNYTDDTVSYGDSMPIATRSGWLATGCLPFVILMAGKSNLVTAVTGVSHEKLQVFHRWISYAMFVLALIHTFPFVVYHIRIGDMVEQWNTSVFYWTGVVALLAQAWLTFASIGPIRNLGYEWFKFSHFLAALVFTLFFFFHCDFTLSAAQFFIVTVVLFAVSWLHRQLRIYFEHGVRHKATLSLAANGFVRVTVPTQARWRVGQHFFVRFMSLGLDAWAVHPFTACSLPVRASAARSSESELVFYIRPQGGFTARLARHVEAHPESQTRVLLDGPYGGVDMQKFVACQRTVVVVGGSGAGWALPFVAAFLRRLQIATLEMRRELSLRVILATRDSATQAWFKQAVARELAACPVDSTGNSPTNFGLEVYYTGGTEQSSSAAGTPRSTAQFLGKLDGDPEKALVVEQRSYSSSDEDSNTRRRRRSSGSEQETGVSVAGGGARHAVGRPDLRAVVAAEADGLRPNGTLGVFVCGPLSMQSDVSNAVARSELQIVKDGDRDLYLHMEHFSWA